MGVALILVVVVLGLIAIVATRGTEVVGAGAEGPSARSWAVPVVLVIALAIGAVIAWKVVDDRRNDGPGATAVWTPAQPPKPSDTSFTAKVTRLGCSSGVTGHVRKPTVTTTDDQITVTFTVDPLPEATYNCIGNPSSTYLVELGEPIGDRELVDGACDGEAAGTSYCVKGGA